MIGRYTTPEMQRIWSQEARYAAWIEVEKTVAEVQGEMGIIPPSAAQKLSAALSRLDPGEVARRAAEKEREVDHDVIAFLMVLEEAAGPEGRYLHYGLTSNDVVDTANALILKRAGDQILEELVKLAEAVRTLAFRHARTPIMGRTHGVFAEPTSLGLKFLNWYAELQRDLLRLEEALEQVRYGKISGAVGNYAHLPTKVEERVLARLGLKPEPVSTQIVPRDRYAAFMAALTLTALALERIALEIRLLQRTEVGELFEPFKPGQRGSSAMPHKRNPIKSERITGLARVMRGYLLSAFENTALWHERDLSNSSVERIILPDATTLLHFMIREMRKIIEGLEIDAERMARNLRQYGDFYYSEPLLLKLVQKGLPRMEAYAYVKEAAFRAQKEGIPFAEAAKAHPGIRSALTEEELREVLNFDFLRHVEEIFRRFDREK